MYQFTYENQGEKSFLVYSVQPSDIIDSVNMGMMSNNKIPGIAPAGFTQMNADRFVKYDISSRIAVAELLSRPVKKKCFLSIFSGIAEGVLSAQDYMLDPAALVLDPAYIYSDVSGENLQMICLPVAVNAPQPDLHAFFKNIVFNIQCDPAESGDYFIRIVNYLNTETFSLQSFKKLLKSLSAPAPAQPAPAAPASRPAAAPRPAVPGQAPQPAAPAPGAQRPAPVQQKAAARPAPAQPRPAAKPQPAAPASGKPVSPVPAGNPAAQPAEKEISLFGLLRHYDKETAAAYKAQQSAKKAAAEPKQPAKKTKAAAPSGFAIPGQPSGVAQAPQRPAAPARPAAQPAPAQQRPAVQAARPAVSPQPVPAPVSQRPGSPAPAAQPSAQAPSYTGSLKSNFGETIMLGGGGIGETITIIEPQKAAAILSPHLVRMKSNERIPISNASFRLGREPGFADYCISDNNSVGRSHACIITRGEQYFVVDTNSRNHTYVNGEMIPSNVEVEIKHGDTISLANEAFQFKVI